MTILWCGGEELDFKDVAGFFSGDYWPGYVSTNARSSIPPPLANTQGYAYSKPLSTPISSGWFTIRIYPVHQTYGDNLFDAGLCKYGANAWLGVGSGSSYPKLALFKYNGTTLTKLAEEDTGSFYRVDGVPKKIDIHIVSYSTDGQVIVYLDGTEIINYSGDVTSSGQTTLDSVIITSGNTWSISSFSEIIVADEDTRLMRLKTLAPSAAGDTSTNWTGAYTDIDEVTLSDSDKIYSATDNADFQCNLTGMPSGTWSVKAVKVAARCVDGSGSTGIQLGIKSGGTVNVGDTQTASGYWQTKERLMQVNPITGVSFTPAEIEALQFNCRAKAV